MPVLPPVTRTDFIIFRKCVVRSGWAEWEASVQIWKRGAWIYLYTVFNSSRSKNTGHGTNNATTAWAVLLAVNIKCNTCLWLSWVWAENGWFWLTLAAKQCPLFCSLFCQCQPKSAIFCPIQDSQRQVLHLMFTTYKTAQAVVALFVPLPVFFGTTCKKISW